MRVYDIIYKKRNEQKLSDDEIKYIIAEYTKGSIPDYQMAAFLMAVFIRGMSPEELSALTKAMTESGEIMELSEISAPKIDKHSTGGVGDGISLALAPLVASFGVVVPMMSGRGLGHTGGTLDKLESIPGFRVGLSADDFKSQLRKIGVAIIGQTAQVAPADKKIYALRDVTATVDSIPLIAASIMSKKLAAGASGLLLDVKTGSGAFMKTHAASKALAEVMVAIGKNSGKKMWAIITDMNQPLGCAVGNSLEIDQSINVLKDEGPEDFKHLLVETAARMLVLAGSYDELEKSREAVLRNIKNGSALRKFAEMVDAQGGEPKVTEKPNRILPQSKFAEDISAGVAGYVKAIQTDMVGICSLELGAGRAKKEDIIDYSAGIILHKKVGDKVETNDVLATFFYNRPKTELSEIKSKFINSYAFADEAPKKIKMICDEIK